MHEAEKAMARLLDEVIALRQQVASLQLFAAERTYAEAEMRKAKEAAETADRAKTEFIATLSHELRTPLSIILGYIELLLDGGFGEVLVKQQDVLARVQQNSRQLLELISGLLDLSRLDAGRLPVEFTEVGVPELLRAIEREIAGLHHQTQLDFVWQIDESLPLVCTDPAKLKVVIKNLIGNAVKFTKQGSITVETQPHAGGVEIRVVDTGVGIPKEALPVIFEPFQQLDAAQGQGTGLGLHIVKRLLALLGGSITVDSEVGRGSTFCVWVPATGSPSPATKGAGLAAATKDQPETPVTSSPDTDTTCL
jgi:signal transduction histidine kinase